MRIPQPSIIHTRDGEDLWTSDFPLSSYPIYYDPEKGDFRGSAYNAATRIQATWRGKKARNLAENLRYRPGGPGYVRARERWASAGGGSAAGSGLAAEYARRGRKALEWAKRKGISVKDGLRRRIRAIDAEVTEADKAAVRRLEKRVRTTVTL